MDIEKWPHQDEVSVCQTCAHDLESGGDDSPMIEAGSETSGELSFAIVADAPPSHISFTAVDSGEAQLYCPRCRTFHKTRPVYIMDTKKDS